MNIIEEFTNQIDKMQTRDLKFYNMAYSELTGWEKLHNFMKESMIDLIFDAVAQELTARREGKKRGLTQVERMYKFATGKEIKPELEDIRKIITEREEWEAQRAKRSS